jgi:hypothetical protein
MSESPVPTESSAAPDAAVAAATPEAEASALSSPVQTTPADPSAPPPETAPSVLVKVESVPASDTETTNPALESLNERQRIVIQCLGSGMNITAAAQGAGVDPRTIHRWIKSKPEFAAAFNAWKQETYEIARARALTMGERAMGVIDAAIDKGNLSASLQVARGLGMLTPHTTGETTPKRVYRVNNVVDRLKEKHLHDLETSAYASATTWTDSVAGWDNLLWQELHQRDGLVWEAEMHWREYEKSLHLTEEECNRRLKFTRPKGPPAMPRPSHFEVLASFERMCKKLADEFGTDATARFNEFIEDGRIAAEAAKGREQALRALGIAPAEPAV